MAGEPPGRDCGKSRPGTGADRRRLRSTPAVIRGRHPDRGHEDVPGQRRRCTWPRSGVRDVGENRDQEAAPKAAEVAAAGIESGGTTSGSCSATSAARWPRTPPQCTRWTGRRWSRWRWRTSSDGRAGVAVPTGCALGAGESRWRHRHRGGAARSDVPALADAIAGQPSLRLAGRDGGGAAGGGRRGLRRGVRHARRSLGVARRTIPTRP